MDANWLQTRILQPVGWATGQIDQFNVGGKVQSEPFAASYAIWQICPMGGKRAAGEKGGAELSCLFGGGANVQENSLSQEPRIYPAQCTGKLLCLTGGRCLLTFCHGGCLGIKRLIHQTQEPRIARLSGELSSQLFDGSGFPFNIISSWRAKLSLSHHFVGILASEFLIEDHRRQLPQSLGNEAAELVNQVGIGCSPWKLIRHHRRISTDHPPPPVPIFLDDVPDAVPNASTESPLQRAVFPGCQRANNPPGETSNLIIIC